MYWLAGEVGRRGWQERLAVPAQLPVAAATQIPDRVLLNRHEMLSVDRMWACKACAGPQLAVHTAHCVFGMFILAFQTLYSVTIYVTLNTPLGS
jgi:hypothetical protein